MVEFLGSQLLRGDTLQKRDGRQDVAVCRNFNVFRPKTLLEQTTSRDLRESPAPGVGGVVAVDLADAGNCCQQDSAWLEDTMHVAHRRMQIVDELQRLRQDEAVERIGGNIGRI